MKQFSYYLFFFCTFFFSSHLILAQSTKPKNLSFKAAKTAIKEGQFEKALAEYNRIAVHYKEAKNWDTYLLTLDSLSYELVITPVKKELLPILQEGEKIIEEHKLSEALPEKTIGIYIRLGEWYYKDFNFDKAFIYLNKAFYLIKNKSITNSYLSKYYNHLALLNYYKGNLEKVIVYADSLYMNAERLGDVKLLNFAISIKAIALTKQRKFDEANQLYDKAFSSLEKLGGNPKALGDILSNQASILYFEQDKIYESIETNRRALEFYPETDLSSRFPTLTNLGIAYYQLNDFDEAMKYNSYALTIGKEHYGEDSPELVENYSILSKIEFHKRNFGQARIAMSKAIAMRTAYEGDNRWYGILNEYSSFAMLELIESNYKEANKIADTLANFKLKASLSDLRYGYLYSIQGRIALATKKYNDAVKYFGDAATYFNKISSATNEADYRDNQAEMLRLLGETYLQSGDYQKALKRLQEALDIVSNNSTKTDVFTNPSFDDVIDKFSYIQILKDKADAFLGLGLPNSTESLLLADSLITEVKGLFDGIESKKALAELSQQIQLKLLETNYTKYLTDKDDFYFKAAFRNSEKIKAINLLEDFHAGELTKISKIPDSLRREELDLTKSIAFYEKELFNLENDNNNEERKEELAKKLFQDKEHYTSLLENFKTNYKDYYQLKFQPSFITIDEIKNNLINSNQTIIEFVEAENLIYVFAIDKNNQQFFSIEKDFSLKALIKGMQESLINYDSLNRKDEDITKYKYVDSLNHYTLKLYQKIWMPIEQQVQLKEKLVIIPDGRLNYIPFDILLKEMPKEKDNERGQFHTYKYLIDDYQISYNYSVTLWNSMIAKKKELVANDLLAFAPSFSESIDYHGVKLESLKHSLDEVKAINQLISGETFIEPEATKANFLLNALYYKIIHLSTHGIINDKLGDYSFLAFTALPDSIENAIVYNRELYNLELNADIVVLSACNTARGELQKGEGVISLARGFAFAGAKSIVSTLWSVDEEATKNLMVSFYEHLRSGIKKDEALYQAKQAYRNTHPLYWAAFIPSGDMSDISFNNWTFFKQYEKRFLIGGMLVFVIILMVFARKYLIRIRSIQS